MVFSLLTYFIRFVQKYIYFFANLIIGFKKFLTDYLLLALLDCI